MATVQMKTLVKRYKRPLVFMLTGGFEHLVRECGAELLGFSLRGFEGDWLLVIRVEFDERPMVGFVGGVTAAGCLVAAEKKLRQSSLKWREDRYNNGG